MTALAPRPRSPMWLRSFAVLVVLGIAWAAVVPLGGQPDEPAHLTKAAAVVRGELTWDDRVDVVSSDPDVLTTSQIVMQAPEAYDRLGVRSYCIARPPMQDASCAPPPSESTDEIDVVNTYTAAYPPTTYLLIGLPTLWLEPIPAMYAARVVMVLLCAALLAGAFTLAAAAPGRRRFTLCGVVVATTPMAIYLTSTPNPNALEVAAAICAGTALVLLLAGRSGTDPEADTGGPVVDRAVVAWFVVSAATLALVRPISWLTLLFVGGWIVLGLGRLDRGRELVAARSARVGAGLVAVAGGLALAWFFYADPLDVVIGWPHPGTDFWDNVGESVSRLPYRTDELVGRFGWGDTDAPRWVQSGWLVLATALAVVALAVGTWRHRAVLVGLVATVVALPTVAELPRVNELGFIWSGRYWLPFAVAIPLLAGGIIADRASADRILRWQGARWVVLGVVGFCGASQFAALAAGASRYAAGDPTELLAFAQDPPWSSEIGPTWTLVLVLTATVAYTVWLAWLAWLPSDDLAPEPPEQTAPGYTARR